MRAARGVRDRARRRKGFEPARSHTLRARVPPAADMNMYAEMVNLTHQHPDIF